jgi:hypothetical protein
LRHAQVPVGLVVRPELRPHKEMPHSLFKKTSPSLFSNEFVMYF